VAPPVPQESAQTLKAQAEYFESALENVRKRIAELEAAQQKEKS
jgi:prefoldin subunit 5